MISFHFQRWQVGTGILNMQHTEGVLPVLSHPFVVPIFEHWQDADGTDGEIEADTHDGYFISAIGFIENGIGLGIGNDLTECVTQIRQKCFFPLCCRLGQADKDGGST